MTDAAKRRNKMSKKHRKNNQHTAGKNNIIESNVAQSNVLNLILAVISVLGISLFFLSSSGSITNILFLVILFYFYRRYGFCGTKRQKIFSLSMAGIFSLLSALGKISRSDENITDTLGRYTDSVVKDAFHHEITLSGWKSPGNIILMLIMVMGIFIVLYFLFLSFFRIYEDLCKADRPEKHKFPIKLFGISFIFIIICWIPYLILNYPGVVAFDTITQYKQILGLMPYSNHHPLFHTFFMKICYDIGMKLFGNINAGVGLCSFAQMCIVSLIFSYVIAVLYKNGVKLKYCICILAFYALVPINGQQAVTILKNFLYSGFVLLLSVLFYQIFICREDNRFLDVIFPVSIFLATTFRSNGRIMFILCLPFIFMCLKNFAKKKRIYLIVSALFPLVLSFVITGYVFPALGFETHDTVESLHMPMQHIARTVIECEDELTPADIEGIKKFCASDMEEIKKTYNCRHANAIKELMRREGKNEVISANKADFLKFYLALGIRHPLPYIKAEIDMTVGYFNSDIQYIYTMMYGVYKNDLGITQYFPDDSIVCQKFRKFCEVFRYVPLYGNLFNPPTVFLLIIFITGVLLYAKKYVYIMVSLPVLMDLVTIFLAAPIHAQVCYVYSQLITIPLILAVFYMSFFNKKISA